MIPKIASGPRGPRSRVAGGSEHYMHVLARNQSQVLSNSRTGIFFYCRFALFIYLPFYLCMFNLFFSLMLHHNCSPPPIHLFPYLPFSPDPPLLQLLSEKSRPPQDINQI